jgi:hypothetical protein
MNWRIWAAMLLTIALSNRLALAAQNVANTAQKGSLLIYPAVDVTPTDLSNTLIEISNDENSPIQIECYYVNERKDRVDFGFGLTAKQTASWDVLSGTGTISAPRFPSGGTFQPGNPSRGELICFAVDSAVANQVAFNHLSGTATITQFNELDAGQAKQAFRYNAWSFTAEGAPPDYAVIGTPGRLTLSGGGLGTYDACPQYNIVNLMPGEDNRGSGARLGVAPASLYTIGSALTFVSCNQDLRQDFVLHLTKLQLTVWNANEQSFTGSYACVDSLGKLGPDSDINVTNGSNFSRSTLRTDSARVQVQGVASTQCPGSENAAILGVFTSLVSFGTDAALAVPLEDQELGSTTQGAGFEPGFVLWDPAGPVPQSKASR